MNPFISLIIPCYRNAATLARALDSVLAQTHPVDEIIVVNDCSPETIAIEKILEGYASVKYIKNLSNVGVSQTKNNGIAIAQGDILTFLDADDEWHPQKIELQLNLFREDSVLTSAIQRVPPNGKALAGKVYSKPTPFKIMRNEKKLLWRNVLMGPAMMISKKLMTEIGWYDETLLSSEDFDLWIRLLERRVPVYVVDLPLYVYYYNPSGLSKNAPKISYAEQQMLRSYFHRHHQIVGDSLWSATIWSVYLIRHLRRYEQCRDENLKLLITNNIAMLAKHPVLKGLILFIQSIHLLKLAS
jgi:glycosyltransferase involved in cell wall biosynthesis